MFVDKKDKGKITIKFGDKRQYIFNLEDENTKNKINLLKIL